MAESIPSLRRVVAELQEKLRVAESKPAVIQYVDKPVDRIVEVIKEVTVDRVEYRDRVEYIEREVKVPVVEYIDRVVEKPVPFEVEKRVEVIKEVPVEKIVYRDREVKVPFEVEKIVYRDVVKPSEPVAPEVIYKTVEIPVDRVEVRVVPFETVRVEYQDNPAHIETIRKLQEKLCQFTSQSDSSQNTIQSGQ